MRKKGRDCGVVSRRWIVEGRSYAIRVGNGSPLPILEARSARNINRIFFNIKTKLQAGKKANPTCLTAMSTASKLTLAGTVAGTIGVVVFVHWAQTAEKAVSSVPIP